MESLNLKELIHTVRQELIDSESERIEKGLSPLFKVENLKIEVNFVIEQTKKTGGKIGIKIVDVGHDVTYSNQQIHKIMLELKTCDESDMSQESIATSTLHEGIHPLVAEGAYQRQKKLHPRGTFPGVRASDVVPRGYRPGKVSGSEPGITARNVSRKKSK